MKLTDKNIVLMIVETNNYSKEKLERALEWHREIVNKLELALERGEYLDGDKRNS